MYGKATITGGTDTGTTRLYTGREFDTETWLYYNRARYYSPELWRFINRDPIWIKDNVDLYSYVGNNPVNYTDPSGMFWVWNVWWIVKMWLGWLQGAYGVSLTVAWWAMCSTWIWCLVWVPLAGYWLTQVASWTATVFDGAVQTYTWEESNLADSVDIVGKWIWMVTDSALDWVWIHNCTAKWLTKTGVQIGIDVFVSHKLSAIAKAQKIALYGWKTMEEVTDIAKWITKKYENLQCVDCAKELQKVFKSKWIPFINLDLTIPKGTNKLWYIY